MEMLNYLFLLKEWKAALTKRNFVLYHILLGAYSQFFQ